jgi:hypothetical protein
MDEIRVSAEHPVHELRRLRKAEALSFRGGRLSDIDPPVKHPRYERLEAPDGSHVWVAVEE